MDSLRGKRRQAYRDIFRGLIRSGILYPFPGMGQYGLAGRDIERSILMLHAQLATNHDCVLFEFRRLSWLLPSGGAAHVRNADAVVFRIYAAKKFVDDLGHVTRCLNTSRLINVSRQKGSP